MQVERHSGVAIAVGLVWLALVLRVPLLEQPLWIDERNTLTMVETHSPVALLWEVPLRQPHFPPYYVALDLLSAVVDPRAGRWLSVATGAVTPAVVYWWARTDLDIGPALSAAAGGALALSPLLVEQAYWLRMYAPLLLLTVCAWIMAWRWVAGTGSWRRYAAVAAVTGSLHPFALCAVVAQLCWIGYELRADAIEEWLSAAAPLAVVTGVGLAVLALEFVPGVAGSEVTLGHVRYTDAPVARALVAPITTLTGTLRAPEALVFALALTLVVGLLAIRNRIWADPVGRLGLCWVLVPLGLLTVAHQLYPIWMLKYLGWLAPGVALVLVAAIREESRLVQVAVLGLLLFMQVNGLLILYVAGEHVSRVSIFGIGARPF